MTMTAFTPSMRVQACYNELKASEEGYTKCKGLLEEFENAVISIENGTMTTDLDGNINDRIAEVCVAFSV